VLSQTSNFTDYTQGGFWWKEQEELWKEFKNLTEKGCQAMLSNHNTDRIKELYKGFPQKIVHATRMINANATKRWTIEEIVVLNY
jgi:DNA adenine methylase